MRNVARVQLVVALLGAIATPALAQDDSWQDKWYWGAQSGSLFFKTPTQEWSGAFSIGGHWLITKDRVALLTSVDQIYFPTTTSVVSNGASATGFTTVEFRGGRRIQASLYAIPTDNQLQVYAGVGFSINQITDPIAVGTASPTEEAAAIAAIDRAGTKAAAVLSAGAQWRSGRWAFFGTYQYSPSAGDFLITSEQHVILGGIRYALTRRSEAVSAYKR